MTSSKRYFFECGNPACCLRFPGSDGSLRMNRCPVCRSVTHVVAEIEDSTESKSHRSYTGKWHIEVLLDNIRSAWNVGSILRTSDGIGIKKVHCCGITPSLENPKVTKTALGAELKIPWEKHNNGVIAANNLKMQGFAIWVLEDLPGATPLFQLDVDSIAFPLILVVGNEFSGVDPGIIELSDRLISIPMLGMKRSYNVSVAFGIAASFLLYLLNDHSVSHESVNILPNI